MSHIKLFPFSFSRLPLLASALLLHALPASAQSAAEPLIAPRTPQELHSALAVAFNSKDVSKILTLYENDAALVPQPGSVVAGRAQITEALKGFLAVPGRMQVDTIYAVQAGDLALTRSTWSIRDGAEIKIQASGTEVMRRQADGTWRFAIDHPFGADTVK